MKKFYHSISIIQLILIIAAYILEALATRKTGVLNYLAALNQKWEAHFPIMTLQHTSIVLLCALTAGVIVFATVRMKEREASVVSAKKKQVNAAVVSMKKRARSLAIQAIVLLLCFVFFTLGASSQSYHSYYFLSLALLAGALLQNIKILIYQRDPNILSAPQVPAKTKKKSG